MGLLYLFTCINYVNSYCGNNEQFLLTECDALDSYRRFVLTAVPIFSISYSTMFEDGSIRAFRNISTRVPDSMAERGTRKR